MTDRELLELAAKAAGVEGQFTLGSGEAFELLKPYGFQLYWNPLTDDGDALRLAVKLKLDVFFHPDRVEAHISGRKMIASKIFREEFKFCGNDSTRRAIVRAAAEIGKQMGGRDD